MRLFGGRQGLQAGIRRFALCGRGPRVHLRLVPWAMHCVRLCYRCEILSSLGHERLSCTSIYLPAQILTPPKSKRRCTPRRAPTHLPGPPWRFGKRKHQV